MYVAEQRTSNIELAHYEPFQMTIRSEIAGATATKDALHPLVFRPVNPKEARS